MVLAPVQLWPLVIAACALTGWWLSLRPHATYRGVAPTMQWLIILMAVLMCLLAIDGQRRPYMPATPYAAATSGSLQR